MRVQLEKKNIDVRKKREKNIVLCFLNIKKQLKIAVLKMQSHTLPIIWFKIYLP